MTNTGGSKHANRSAQTRDRFIKAAQKLYAERSIDSVSLNEITVAAGQKNRNALQYHFGNRDGLLQAIIDQHAGAVAKLRRELVHRAGGARWTAAEASARMLVTPVTDYIERNPEGVYYVKILSQVAVLDSRAIDPETRSRLQYRSDADLHKAMSDAVSHLRPSEAQRRIFLAVSLTFHGIADICRAAELNPGSRVTGNRAAMFEQVVGAVAALLAAPARP